MTSEFFADSAYVFIYKKGVLLPSKKIMITSYFCTNFENPFQFYASNVILNRFKRLPFLTVLLPFKSIAL